MNNRILLICFLAFLNFLSLSAQVSQDLIDKAKAAGVSDAQIQQELGKIEAQQTSRSGVESNEIPVISRERFEGDPSLLLSPEVLPEEVDNSTVVYGREIFNNTNLSFIPNFNIPTPKDYQLAAGDELLIYVWGDSEMTLNQTISPEGTIFISDVGPVSLSGLTVEAAQIKIRNELGRIISSINQGERTNTFVSVSLGKIRSLNIHIVGEVVAPGTYTLPALATLFNALYMAGGVNDIGSLRNIRVFRNSKEIAHLDVYDYLMNGVYNANVRLENNDMIIVGPYEQLVSIQGQVKRNRIFEMKNGETLAQLLDMAGGFTGDAYTEEVMIKRRRGDSYRIHTVEEDHFNQFVLHDGDTVNVSGAIPFYENRLTISGAVWRPGEYELTPDISSVRKLVLKAKGLKGDEFSNRAQITRLNEDFTKTLLPVDIKGIMAGTSPDILLQNEDHLYIPSHFDLREPYSVRIWGAVNEAGEFPFQHNMTIEDVIILAGGLQEAASAINVEVARRIKNPMSSSSNHVLAETHTFTLSEDLMIPYEDEIFILEPFDEIFVRYSPEYSQQQIVQVRGEVTFVGEYVLAEKNFRLSDVINKAGGLTPDAYIKGASLKRQVTEDEMRRLETLLDMSANQSENDSIDVSSIDLSVYTVGINLERALSRPGSVDDLVLKDGDELYIPQMQNTVKISGSVNYPNSVTYSDRKSVKDYLSQSGGYLDNARKYPIVIYMNGMVATTKRTGIFFKKYPKVEPGSEIIVPARTYSDRKVSPMEIMSIASSTTSMAAMVTSIINTLGKSK